MITADKVKLLTSQTPTGLSLILKHNGRNGCSFKNAEFLGITNGGEFCYKVTFYNEEGDDGVEGKVFLSYNQSTGGMTADF